MAISIIIPAYNVENFLEATLESVLAQTVGDWEVVVVNDGSSDQTGTVAEAFARRDKRITVVHQTNSGIAAARNRGFSESRADYEYCLFLDSDDLLEPDALAILLQALRENPKAIGAHGILRYINSEGQPMTVNGSTIAPRRRRGIRGRWAKIWPVSEPTTFAVLAYANCIPTCALMLRRAGIEAVGNFDQNAAPCDDWDMWLRLSRLGDISFVNRVIYLYRMHEGNISKRRQLMYDRQLYIRKKMYQMADLDRVEKHNILWGHRYHELHRARINLGESVRKLWRGRTREGFQQFHTAIRHVFCLFKGIQQFT